MQFDAVIKTAIAQAFAKYGMLNVINVPDQFALAIRNPHGVIEKMALKWACCDIGEFINGRRQHRPAFLAEGLKRSGGPCPVCGSKSHPHLALPAGSLPSELELKQAQERFTQAEFVFNRATVTATQRTSDVEKLKGRLEAFLETLGDHADETSEAMAAQEADYRQGLEGARRALEDLAFTTEKIRNKEAEKLEAEAAIGDLRTRCAAAQTREASASGLIRRSTR